MDGRTYEWMEGHMNGWKDIRMDGRTYEWMEGHMNEWKDIRMDASLNIALLKINKGINTCMGGGWVGGMG